MTAAIVVLLFCWTGINSVISILALLCYFNLKDGVNGELARVASDVKKLDKRTKGNPK